MWRACYGSYMTDIKNSMEAGRNFQKTLDSSPSDLVSYFIPRSSVQKEKAEPHLNKKMGSVRGGSSLIPGQYIKLGVNQGGNLIWCTGLFLYNMKIKI
jgi:hypothetical protein